MKLNHRHYPFIALAFCAGMLTISRVNLTAATASASTPAAALFIKADTVTQGNWKGIYGTDGFNVINDSISYPSYAVVTTTGTNCFTWSTNTADMRALAKGSSSKGRIAASWYSGGAVNSNFSVDVNFSDGNTHLLSMYFLDWDNSSRAERIDVMDTLTGATLDTRSLSSFAATPRYLVWSLSGHVRIKVTRTAGSNAVVSGLFFDTPAPAVAPPPAAPPTAVVVSPANASVRAGQSVQFSASVTGSTNTNVLWSVSPVVGSINNGLYTAPGVLNTPQTITVTATSTSDPTKSASAAVSLIPVVSVAVTPNAASLQAGQTMQFSASVSGSTNTSVLWSVSPVVGSINNGLYTAPGVLNTPQTVSVICASAADPSKTATALVSLVPTVTVTVTPTSAALMSGQSVQLNASLTGTLNTGVTWSLNPTLGTISVAGQYVAPIVNVAQNITVLATSLADPTKSASAVLTVSPLPITLPVEVVGPPGNTESVTVTISPTANLTGTIKLWMQVHGLEYADKGSVQVNNIAFIPLDDTTVTYTDRSAMFGGMGGGFNTHKFYVTLPQGTLVPGQNTINFLFSGTQGGVGFRVLKFNFLQSDGTMLLPPSTFVDDDPNTWQPPLPNASDIAAGKVLFQTASILHGGVPTKVHCMDCHTQDGRDFKYFNYSNKFIHYGAIKSGLSATQADQIASYIRSIDFPNPGRPWNPPYQPGPGMDSKPVSEWAAGAGLDAVLDDDTEMLPYLLPGGSTANFAANSYLNQREIPIAFQLMDWNHWLPTVHPVDGWGDTFTTSALYQGYLGIRASLIPNDPASYHSVAFGQLWPYWTSNLGNLTSSLTPSASDPSWQDPNFVAKLHAIRLWNIVKLWELNQEFGLEGMAQAVMGPTAPSRAWWTNVPFYVGPNVSGIPRTAPGIGNGLEVTHIYHSAAWYQLQLLLDDGNGKWAVDWFYGIGYPINDFTWDSGKSKPRDGTAGYLIEWLVKALQLDANDDAASPAQLVGFPAQVSSWSEVSPSQKVQLMDAYVSAWFAKFGAYTPAQFLALNVAKPANTDATKMRFSEDLIYALPQLRYQGVDITLLNNIAAWAATIWPTYNWVGDLNSSCSVHNLGQITCP